MIPIRPSIPSQHYTDSINSSQTTDPSILQAPNSQPNQIGRNHEEAGLLPDNARELALTHLDSQRARSQLTQAIVNQNIHQPSEKTPQKTLKLAVRQERFIETSDNILRPVINNGFVNYEPALIMHPSPSWPQQRHPQNPVLSNANNDPYHRNITELARLEESGEVGLSSKFNGYKYQSPDLQSGIRNFKSIPGIRTNPKLPYTADQNFREKAQVSHYEVNANNLRAGDVLVGEHGHVDLENFAEADMRSARTFGHSHPPGPHTAWEPSLRDQATAREMPHVQTFVKVPDVARKQDMDILQFNGAFPPRHYISLPNPQNHPVRPDSPDIPPSPGGTLQYPPFKNPPAIYQGPPVAYPGPHGYDSRSPSPAED
jgi:hypothetical protein